MYLVNYKSFFKVYLEVANSISINMNKQLFCCIILLGLFTASWAQEQQFVGTLTYEQHTELSGGDSDLISEYERKFLMGYDSLVCHIYDSTHIKVITYNRELGFNRKSVQKDGELQVFSSSGKLLNLSKWKSTDVDDFSVVKETEEERMILGLKCRKIHYDSKSGLVQREAWVADTLPYQQLHEKGLLFNDFFTPHGLIMELTITTLPDIEGDAKILLNHFRIKEISIKNLTE